MVRPLLVIRGDCNSLIGLISVAGYHQLVNELWLGLSRPRQSDMRASAFSNALIMENLPWGFLPWENNRRTSKSGLYKEGLSQLSSTSSMRQLLDLYAESLRYSSRMLSQVYYSSQRRVPAHGPHFISTSIFDDAHKKLMATPTMTILYVNVSRFLQPWSQTARHRFRSPNDVQFAFTYFYFLMTENATSSLSDVMHSVDSDHSG